MLRKTLYLAAFLGLAACQSHLKQPEPYDYTAFKASDPKSILVLPPINQTPDVNAVAGVYSSTTYPLSEAGYYVFPAAVVMETFKQNGLYSPDDIHQVSLKKLQEIFGSDAVLYITINQYGTRYQLVQSDTTVSVSGRLVDARTGTTIWSGSARVSNEKNNNNSNLIGMLISAVINQIVDTVQDRGYDIAQVAGNQLLSPTSRDGILYGRRSPHYTAQEK